MHTFPDGSQGVIFFVNNEGHGLAVSLQEENRVWDTNRGRNMQDIPEIPNSESARPFINQIGEGEINTAAILRHLSSYECPAASWCTSLGEGWYLPTASELLYLLKIANEGRGEDGPISRALSTNGGIEIDESWYWTSSESERTEAINISKRGSIATEDKDDTNAVRAVRAF